MPVSVTVPAPVFASEITEPAVVPDPSAITPENARSPAPPSVSVLLPEPDTRRLLEIESNWPAVALVIVAPPVVPDMAKTLLVVSVPLPIQLRPAAVEPLPIAIVPLVPSELTEPAAAPRLAAASVPPLRETLPVNAFAVPESVTVPVPVFKKLITELAGPAPISPEKPMLPLPPSVNVLLPVPLMKRSLVIPTRLPPVLLLIVPPPVVPASRKTLLVVSVPLPIHLSSALLLDPPS